MSANIWDSLLCTKRFRPSGITKHLYDGRNEFENDFTRIILSPHFRRLQDKAQVFPYDDSDFVRTRLTHSLEVSNFAHSLGLSVETKLSKKGLYPSKLKGQLSSLLATAGLCHDIGNPPFGHFGEECIQTFFKSVSKESEFLELDDAQKNDFLKFDGNAQGFRLLRKLGPSPDKFSYNLTYATLSSIIKYPYSSTEGNVKKSEKISKKKFGYFQSEKDDFDKISTDLGLGNRRHPLVFLLEAADDIAYSVSDIEDGCKKGIITRDVIYDTLNACEVSTKFKNGIKRKLGKILKKIDENHPNRFIIQIQRFRIDSHSKMLIEAAKCFMKNYDQILDGRFDLDLMKESDARELRTFFENLAYINFKHPTVLKRELAGQRALNFHLETFYNAIIKGDGSNPKSQEAKLFNLVSKNYLYVKDKLTDGGDSNYYKMLLLTDFISGMTDSFALRLFHELSGIEPY